MSSHKKRLLLSILFGVIVLIAAGVIYSVKRNASADQALTKVSTKYKEKVEPGDSVSLKADDHGNRIYFGTTKDRLIVLFMKKETIGYRPVATKVETLTQIDTDEIGHFWPVRNTRYFAFGKMKPGKKVVSVNGKKPLYIKTKNADFWYSFSKKNSGITVEYKEK
ncbi:hypothetical protein [Lentilactobacillus sp. Marseille-Q4993]|uniref:hypothetical protein n=1 Tax=Lentilactobacillus sp. Marseille-Q4993 TaxID=3039492 RepID=UPI0024BCE4C5|nr:hypothetical protein [Lentilactobacillus sp. Marseille-Q4993]